MLLALSVAFGSFVGFALGLTGGGGAIFAVPLLVYGLAVGPREAASVSLASVGCTALVGCWQRWRNSEVEGGVGLLFALAGMPAAPLGVWVGRLLPEPLLLLFFALLMVVMALRMWRHSVKAVPAHDEGRNAAAANASEPSSPWNGQRAALLGATGLVTGFLSGLFGVGGGFLIVPALVLFGGLAMHRAIGTSLLAIALISLAGTIANAAGGRLPRLDVTVLFVIGGMAGMALGTALSRRLSGPWLQRLFAGAILAVAVFVGMKTLSSGI